MALRRSWKVRRSRCCCRTWPVATSPYSSSVSPLLQTMSTAMSSSLSSVIQVLVLVRPSAGDCWTSPVIPQRVHLAGRGLRHGFRGRLAGRRSAQPFCSSVRPPVVAQRRCCGWWWRFLGQQAPTEMRREERGDLIRTGGLRRQVIRPGPVEPNQFIPQPSSRGVLGSEGGVAPGESSAQLRCRREPLPRAPTSAAHHQPRQPTRPRPDPGPPRRTRPSENPPASVRQDIWPVSR